MQWILSTHSLFALLLHFWHQYTVVNKRHFQQNSGIYSSKMHLLLPPVTTGVTINQVWNLKDYNFIWFVYQQINMTVYLFTLLRWNSGIAGNI